MTTQREHILIGLPETGKTTFLAALWHVLCAEDGNSELRLKQLHDDHNYLNTIRERWVKAEIQDRTVPSAEAHVSMLLTGDSIDGDVEISIPDLSGESYESVWSYRRINKDRANAISRAEGILLFIHPDRVEKETLISEVDDIVDELDEDEEEETEERAEWDAQKAPTQVQLVDLIQCVLRLNEHRRLRLGVVVSAWDRVNDSTTPAEWIERSLPLLWQFMRANDDSLMVGVFGVSAQGGQLPSEAERLRELDRPTERIMTVCGDDDTGSDITAPIRWLMATAE